MFGFLIFVHEFGHYITARICKVQINEFSLGMGPKIFGFRSKKTGILYALRLLPIGGYVSMEGENGNVEGISSSKAPGENGNVEGISSFATPGENGNVEGISLSETPEENVNPEEEEKPFGIVKEKDAFTQQAMEYRAKCEPFNKKSVWKRMLITVAGGVTNLIIGAIIMTAYILTTPAIGGTVVAEFAENAVSVDQGLCELDEIVSIDGTKVTTSTALLYEISQTGGEPCEVVINRGKYSFNEDNTKIIKDDEYEQMTLEISFAPESEQGIVMGVADFTVYRVQKNFVNVVKQSWSHTVLAGKMVWESLVGLITGRYGLSAMSGPIGTGEVIGQAASYGISQLLYLVALISVNLGIANLLPIPALDGGRLTFQVIEVIRRKPVSERVEGIIHSVGIIVLMALMLIIAMKDTIGLFN